VVYEEAAPPASLEQERDEEEETDGDEECRLPVRERQRGVPDVAQSKSHEHEPDSRRANRDGEVTALRRAETPEISERSPRSVGTIAQAFSSLDVGLHGSSLSGTLTAVTRVGLLFALAVGLSLVAPALSADQTRIATHCSPSGDVCYGVFREQAGLIHFKLTLAAKYFSRYRICVRPLGQAETCKRFRVRKTGTSAWGGNIVWQRNFPQRGVRTYKVTWKRGATPLGPSLTFTVPAPV